LKSINCCRDYSETNQRPNRPRWLPTCSAREIIYERSMAEANDDISSTEPSLPGAMAWIRRNWKSTWIFGTMDMNVDLERCLLQQWAWIRRFGFREVGFEAWRLLVSMGRFLLFSSYWISARYKWRRHGFLPPTTGGGVSPCAGSTERLPLSGTNR
jgi:hypothetical protein